MNDIEKDAGAGLLAAAAIQRCPGRALVFARRWRAFKGPAGRAEGSRLRPMPGRAGAGFGAGGEVRK